MPKEVELEGTPAEATWAMITVIVVVIVVLIFCCIIPFYRALEKRYHHWEDTEHDPRWDNDQFQFSPTSPRLERSASNSNYNRLSVCSGEESSVTTSNSNVNNTFKNQCLLPRFDDQVQFNLPKKFDDGFLTVPREEVDEEEAAIIGSSPSNKLNLPSQKVGQQPSQSVKRKPIKQNPVSSVENVNENKQNPVTSTKTRITKHNPVPAAKTRVKNEENAKSTISETSQPAAPKRNSKSFPASVNGTSGSNTRPTKFPTKINGQQQVSTETKPANTSVLGGKTSKTRLNDTQTSIVKNPQSPQTSSAETQPVSPPTRKTYKKVKKIPVSSE